MLTLIHSSKDISIYFSRFLHFFLQMYKDKDFGHVKIRGMHITLSLVFDYVFSDLRIFRYQGENIIYTPE